MIENRSLREHFRDALFAMTIRFPIACLFVIYFSLTLKEERLVTLDFFWRALEKYWVFNQQIYWVVMWPVLLFVLTFYPYFRERKPSYIKKQEAYEEWKAEKEAAKQKADEQMQLKK
jgi:hypothetical protein